MNSFRSGIEIGDVIDMDLLSIANNKRAGAASVFGDLSGFTAYIDAADSPDRPPVARGVIFGRDPNALTNALGRLPGDRPMCFGQRAAWKYRVHAS